MGAVRQVPRQDATRRCAVVTLDQEDRTIVGERLDAAGVMVGPIVAWGDQSGYARLQLSNPPLILLHWSSPPVGASIKRHISALGTLGRVVVLTDVAVDIADLFCAGAYDVLDGRAPMPELRARVGAHARRLGRDSEWAPPPQRAPAWSSQRFLLRWLCARSTTFCCHELRTLLGRPGHPLDLRSVRRRLARVVRLLRDEGLDLCEDRFWGAATYRVVEASTQNSASG